MTQASRVKERQIASTPPVPQPRTRRHVLDLDDYSREEIEDVLQNTTAMNEVLQRDIRKVPTLRGKSVITLFLEPSTRTRVSFEQAGKILRRRCHKRVGERQQRREGRVAV